MDTLKGQAGTCNAAKAEAKAEGASNFFFFFSSARRKNEFSHVSRHPPFLLPDLSKGHGDWCWQTKAVGVAHPAKSPC